MRLKRLYLTLAEEIENLKINGSHFSKDGVNYYTYANLNNFRRATYALRDAGVSTQILEGMLASPVFSFVGDSAVLNQKEASNLESGITWLIVVLTSLMETIEPLVGRVSENSIYVRFAEVHDLGDLEESAKQFKVIFENLVYDPNINGTTNIVYFESGSLWLEIALGVQKAAFLVGSVVFAAKAVQSFWFQNRQFITRNKTGGLLNDNLASLNDAQNILVDHMKKLSAEEITENFYGGDSSKIPVVIHAITQLSEQFQKGAVITPSLSAPLEVIMAYPKLNDFILPPAETRELKPPTAEDQKTD